MYTMHAIMLTNQELLKLFTMCLLLILLLSPEVSFLF